ncbi:methyltransferase domain-containing protein [Streptomyces sp. IB2014 016-6]|uniref:methyltransferase domain-containing protein n=1 Tax=Streptomyces sp. IB2014 016-6 TaxID=2517818 RepID=UPI0011CCC7A0|nr:methyltransferase domain-containing protein [Streptomyces sp. IB2014 016-6]TXL91693.1 methyltransferase domain-containing protein [Streptomyces sp. IB2014 016-6]
MDQARSAEEVTDGYARLLAGLTESGALAEGWRGAFESAPRAEFVPEAVWAPDEKSPTGHRRITRAAEPETWWALVDADEVVVTQLDDGAHDGPGVPTSSASQPSLVASMLRHLDVVDGARVLDIGTGTGWTSALLAARLGDRAVTTVEVDPRISSEAAHRLKDAGLTPAQLVVGDGLAGWPKGAPYDHIHSTAAVRRVPRTWIEQTRPGATIVTPWGTPYANAGLLRLVTGGPGGPSYGRFVDNVSFMWMRAQRPHAVTLPPTEPDLRGPSAIDPDLVLSNVDVAFTIGLRVPHARYAHTWDAADPAVTYRIVLSDGNGSWASVRYEAWDAPDAVCQWGTRRLWDEITAARGWWEDRGHPELTRFGLTVTPHGGQTPWLDTPSNLVARPRSVAE